MKAISLHQPWASLCPELAARLGTMAGPDACWVWRGPCSRRGGYGLVHIKGVIHKAHRLAWELTHGPIPDGLHVLHSCDNPPCCNPAHLRLGTHAENMADKAARGRAPSLGGALNGNARLTPEAVDDIRVRLTLGMSVRSIAAWFGVDRRTIRRIRDGESWT